MFGTRFVNAAKAFVRLSRDNPDEALKSVTRAAKASALGTLYVRQRNRCHLPQSSSLRSW